MSENKYPCPECGHDAEDHDPDGEIGYGCEKMVRADNGENIMCSCALGEAEILRVHADRLSARVAELEAAQQARAAVMVVAEERGRRDGALAMLCWLVQRNFYPDTPFLGSALATLPPLGTHNEEVEG